MPIPAVIGDLNTTASLNSPSGSDNISTSDDYLRAIQGIVKTVYDAQTIVNATISGKADLTGATFTGAIETKRATVAATATTTPLWTTSNGNVQDWTGTPTITTFPNAPQAGSQRIVYPAAGTVLTNNANISVQGNANYTAAAGDEWNITAITVSTFYVTIKRKDGLPVSSISSSKIQSVSSSVAANALTLNYNGGTLDFRNASLTNGVPVTLSVAANSIVIPSTATLGTINAIQARLVLLEAYNGGSPVLCVANLAGGLQLEETNLISPTTISTGATSASVIYSASAVSANSPYRVVGFVDITEATAGTWATDATFKQGTGGQALASLSGIGYGQNWQSFTLVSGTTYYNIYGKPIMIKVTVTGTPTAQIQSNVNGQALQLKSSSVTGGTFTIEDVYIVPPNQSYFTNAVAGSIASAFVLR